MEIKFDNNMVEQNFNFQGIKVKVRKLMRNNMKEQRNLDGVYFRVEREGVYESVSFSDLEENEMLEVLKNKDKEWIIQLAIILGTVIYNIGEQFDIARGE